MTWFGRRRSSTPSSRTTSFSHPRFPFQNARTKATRTTSACRPCSPASSTLPSRCGPSLHEPERVVVEGVHLDGLPVARRHHPVADLRVHPGELCSGGPGHEEAVLRIHSHAVAGAALVGAEDLPRRREHLVAEECLVTAGLEPGVHRLEHPERRVGGVVLGLAGPVRESVRDDAVVEPGEEALDHGPCIVEPAPRDQQAGQRDHRVTPPVGEPRIAGDHGRLALGVPHQELLGGEVEPGQQRILESGSAPVSLGRLEPGDLRAVEDRHDRDVLATSHDGDPGTRSISKEPARQRSSRNSRPRSSSARYSSWWCQAPSAVNGPPGWCRWSAGRSGYGWNVSRRLPVAADSRTAPERAPLALVSA